MEMWNDLWPELRNRYIFQDIDREFADAEDMLNRMFKTVREIEMSSNVDTTNNVSYHYGYQITVDPDGKPHIREFGNVRPSAKGLIEHRGVREPLVDTTVDEKENTLRITAEMPGVDKDHIKVNITDKSLSIHAEKEDKKYHAVVPVTIELDNATAKASYSNGILELKIKLRRQVPPKLKRKEVKVE
jgi:HSP20 family protein